MRELGNVTDTAATIRKRRKLDQVLAGAREVFLRDGFEGASVDDIARAAGVSKATLYSYFPDKRRLFSEMASAECRRQADDALRFIDLAASPAVVLRQTAERMVDFVSSDFGQRVFRVCVAESERFPELGQEFYASGPLMLREKLAVYFRMARDRGELVIEDIDLAADQFAELCKANIQLRLVMGIARRISARERARTVEGAVEMFLSRYGAPAARGG